MEFAFEKIVAIHLRDRGEPSEVNLGDLHSGTICGARHTVMLPCRGGSSPTRSVVFE